MTSSPDALSADSSSSTATPSPVARWAGLACLFGTVFLAACGGGGDAAPPPPPPAPAPQAAQITVSGTAQYQSVPAASGGSLNYAAQTFKPIRGATVQLLSNGAAIATTFTSATGAYTFATVANPTTALVVRVRAELQSSVTGGPATDVTVKDNTSSGALYVLDSAPVTVTAATQAIDVRADSGWGGTSYTAARSAAPFAVLDTVYQGVQKVRSAAANQALPPLQVFWSTRNTPADGVASTGAIGTSFFTTADPDTRAPGLRIYLLGAENVDTDEYDSAVVAHEWGHYLQTAVSRDDSVGGPHTRNDRLDMRVAFSEGFGNAFSGMVLGNPRYTDSARAGQASGFVIDVSSAPTTNKGWYSEDSVQYLLWTWHQNAGIGFAPIYSTLTGPMRTSGALVGIHHFASRLKTAQLAAASIIDSTLTGQSIIVQDEWGTGETNTGTAAGTLPLYGSLLNNAARVCVNDTVGEPNKLRNYVYLRFTTTARNATVTLTASGATGTDPDFELIDANGVFSSGDSSVADSETRVVSLPAGTHSLVITDFNLIAQTTVSGERCFNVSVN
jgi:hypothetical protein